MARCLAAAISHAPGFSGMPVVGHRSIAVTRTSWARSSASPTSRTMRTRPPISRADSIRQTASTALRVAPPPPSLTCTPSGTICALERRDVELDHLEERVGDLLRPGWIAVAHHPLERRRDDL